MSDIDDPVSPLHGDVDGDRSHAVAETIQFDAANLQLPWDSDGNVTALSQTIGSPESDAHLWEFQTTPFTCAVMAQRGIIQSFTGEDVSEASLVYEATSHGWLTKGGMDPSDVGNLLELHGVPCHQRISASLEELMMELSQGHKVIVGVDAQELWADRSPLQDFVHHVADHAIWVTGINFDDPDRPRVFINDSGEPDGAGKEYDLSHFMNAWEDSGFSYISTDHAPPNLHLMAPGFDPSQGSFPAMAGYMAQLGTGQGHFSGNDMNHAERYINTMPDGKQMADGILSYVHNIVYNPDPEVIAEGERIANGILLEIEAPYRTAYAGQAAERDGVDHALKDEHDLSGKDGVKFAAGTCYHCGGRGYTTWLSSGSQERCYYCCGSGVAH